MKSIVVSSFAQNGFKGYWCFVAVAVLWGGRPAFAQTAPEVLAYEMPANAVKGEPRDTRFEGTVYQYRLPLPENSKPGERGVLVGSESYINGNLVKRRLWLDGKLHGVQREWFPGARGDGTGALKSEEPYRDGIRDGIFQHYDDKKLVGQYEMKAGTGVRRIYNGYGELIEEVHYEHNMKNGLTMVRTSACYCFLWYENDKLTRPAYQFALDGHLERIMITSSDAKPGGPPTELDTNFDTTIPLELVKARFGQTPKGVRQSWFLDDGQKALAGDDATFPSHDTNNFFYKKLVPAEVRTLLNDYRTASRVKIPLELDVKGEPLLAVTAEQPKP